MWRPTFCGHLFGPDQVTLVGDQNDRPCPVVHLPELIQQVSGPLERGPVIYGEHNDKGVWSLDSMQVLAGERGARDREEIEDCVSEHSLLILFMHRKMR